MSFRPAHLWLWRYICFYKPAREQQLDEAGQLECSLESLSVSPGATRPKFADYDSGRLFTRRSRGSTVTCQTSHVLINWFFTHIHIMVHCKSVTENHFFIEALPLISQLQLKIQQNALTRNDTGIFLFYLSERIKKHDVYTKSNLNFW